MISVGVPIDFKLYGLLSSRYGNGVMEGKAPTSEIKSKYN